MADAIVVRNEQNLAEVVSDQGLMDLFVNGNIAKLSEQDKLKYYSKLCQSLGLNPFTKPFEYIKLSGKETLYVKRDGTDQLRRIYNISLEIISQEILNDCYVVKTKATFPSGRFDTDIGVVNIKGISGDAFANAIMKAVTKSKRRVTLCICGLGFLDETEIETVPNVQNVAGTKPAPSQIPAQTQIIKASPKVEPNPPSIDAMVTILKTNGWDNDQINEAVDREMADGENVNEIKALQIILSKNKLDEPKPTPAGPIEKRYLVNGISLYAPAGQSWKKTNLELFELDETNVPMGEIIKCGMFGDHVAEFGGKILKGVVKDVNRNGKIYQNFEGALA